VLLCDFKVSIDSFSVITRLFPHFSTVEDLLSALIGNSGASRKVFINLVDEMRSMLVSDTESFTVHTGLLVHVDSFLRLLSVDVRLFSLTVFTTLKVEFSLVHEHFSN